MPSISLTHNIWENKCVSSTVWIRISEKREERKQKRIFLQYISKQTTTLFPSPERMRSKFSVNNYHLPKSDFYGFTFHLALLICLAEFQAAYISLRIIHSSSPLQPSAPTLQTSILNPLSKDHFRQLDISPIPRGFWWSLTVATVVTIYSRFYFWFQPLEVQLYLVCWGVGVRALSESFLYTKTIQTLLRGSCFAVRYLFGLLG